MKKKIYTYQERIKAIIIDDDSKSVKFLNHLCQTYFQDDIHIVGVYNHVQQALEDIQDMSLDLIFLDIEMPDMDGFDFMASLSEDESLKIVVVSAHEKYALKAIKYNVFDYIPKPVGIQDIRKLVTKLAKLHHVPNVFNEDYINTDILIVNRQDKAFFVETKDIVRMEANGSYTDIFLDNGTRLSSTKNIKYYEAKLNRRPFFKVHRSHLLNLSKIKELQKNDGDGIIIMQDNSRIVISRSKKNEFLKELTS